MSKGIPPFKESIVISGRKVASAVVPLSEEFYIKDKISSLEIHKPVYVNTVDDVK